MPEGIPDQTFAALAKVERMRWDVERSEGYKRWVLALEGVGYSANERTPEKLKALDMLAKARGFYGFGFRDAEPYPGVPPDVLDALAGAVVAKIAKGEFE